MRGRGVYLTRIMNSTNRTLEVPMIAVPRAGPRRGARPAINRTRRFKRYNGTGVSQVQNIARELFPVDGGPTEVRVRYHPTPVSFRSACNCISLHPCCGRRSRRESCPSAEHCSLSHLGWKCTSPGSDRVYLDNRKEAWRLTDGFMTN